MRKLVQINKRRFLGDYYAQNSEHIPEETFFFAGVTFSMVLPESMLVAYGGLVPLIVFASVALLGSLWGLVRYYQSPREFLSCFGKESRPQAPPSETPKLKKAA